MIHMTASTKGGVGKSALAVMIGEIHRVVLGKSLKLIDIDPNHKMAKVLGEDKVIKIEGILDADELAKNPDLAFTYWSEASEHLVGGEDVLIDQGGGITPLFLQYCAATGLAEFVGPVTIYIPTTAEAGALMGARRTLELARQAFPDGHMILALNGPALSFEGIQANEDYRALMSDANVNRVSIPWCTCPVYRPLESDGVSYAVALEDGWQTYKDALNIKLPWEAKRQFAALAAWALEAHTVLVPIVSGAAFTKTSE